MPTAAGRRVCLVLLGAGLAASQPDVPVLASCTPAAVMTPGGGERPALSGDGRYLVFDSTQNNLVPGDTNSVGDVFMFDRLTCLVHRLSVNSAEEQAMGAASGSPVISQDGRYVAFLSRAANLMPVPDALGNLDVFVRDRHTGLTLNGSPAFDGGLANGDASPVAISGDGRFVAFWSDASNLIASDLNGQLDVFVRDLLTGTTARATVSFGGGESAGVDAFSRLALSSDGRYIAFSSAKSDLVPGDTNGRIDVFRRDMQTGTTIRVSVGTGGAEIFDGDSQRVAMSRDGRFLAFDSDANNVAVSDTDAASDVFVHDVATNTTMHVSVDSRGFKTINRVSREPSISGDGRYVTFASDGSLAVASLPVDFHIYVRDLATGITRLASVSEAGAPQASGEDASVPALSDNGAFVAFRSTDTTTLAPGKNGTVYISDWLGLSAPQQLNLLHDAGFASGQPWWTPFALPDLDDLVWDTNGGVLNFHREPGSAQAVIFQSTGAQLLPFAPIEATFKLRNTSGTRKRLSVLIHDLDFSDLSVCTFWLDPMTSLQTYSMRMHTTQMWSDATIAFYAATADGVGSYGVDDVTLQYNPNLPDSGTECVDPTAPPPSGLVPGPNLLLNGDFAAGLSPWATFGQIASQIAGGVFEFVRPPGTPAGVVFQATGQTRNDNTRLQASFSLGNSSNVRKRVTVLIHDGDFSDLSACTFWLPPQSLLKTYGMTLFTTKVWNNATVSVYPATVGVEQWIRLDDVTLREVGSATGTTCIEPDLNPRPSARSSSLAGTIAAGRSPDVERRRVTVDGGARRPSVGQAAGPRFTLQFWLPPHDEALRLEITMDGETWIAVASFDPSRDWTLVELDAPTAIEIRTRSVR